MIDRTDIVSALMNRFTDSEREILLCVPVGEQAVTALAGKYDLTTGGIKQRHKRLLRRLRRYITAGQFDFYKDAFSQTSNSIADQ